MSWVESKTKQEPEIDDDDGLPMEILSTDDDDDGLPMLLSADDDDDDLPMLISADDDDDGLPMELNLSDDNGGLPKNVSDDDNEEEDMPTFESNYSKLQIPKKKRKNHASLKLPLIQRFISAADSENKRKCEKLFNKAGRSRDIVIEAEIAVKEALKNFREKRDMWCKITIVKDIQEELIKTENGERLLKELMDVGTRLKLLKEKLRIINQNMNAANQANNKSNQSQLKYKTKLEDEKRKLCLKLEKYKSRQKVLKSEVVDYTGSLTEMEKRLQIMSNIPKDMYTNLAECRKNKKKLKDELSRPGGK